MAKDLVVLLHGITRSNFDMMLLEKRIKDEGFDTLNIKYPSTKRDLDALTDYVYAKIAADKRYAEAPNVNIIAHSMGGLIARHLIYKYRPGNLGKVVMLGTPNNGSEMANFMSDNRLLSKVFNFIFGPAGNQLRTDQDQIDGGNINYPLGVIASDVSLNPLGNHVFGAPNDTLVSVESTKLAGMADHIIMNSWSSTHAMMMFDAGIIRQAIHFLKTGSFDHNDDREIMFIPKAPQDPPPARDFD